MSRVGAVPDHLRLIGAAVVILLPIAGQTRLVGANNGPRAGEGAARASTNAAYDAAVEANKPLAYWPLRDAAGSPVADIVGNSNGAVVGGVTPLKSGQSPTGGGMSFDGNSGYIDLTAHAALLGPTSAVTVEAWIKAAGPQPSPGWKGTSLFRDRSNTQYQDGYKLGLDNGEFPNFTISHYPGPTPSATSDQSVIDGRWHYIVGTYDSRTIRIYVDGTQVGSTSETQPIAPGNEATINRDGLCGCNPSWFFGSMAAVAVYDRALQPTEIEAHYLAAGAHESKHSHNFLIQLQAWIPQKWVVNPLSLPPPIGGVSYSCHGHNADSTLFAGDNHSGFSGTNRGAVVAGFHWNGSRMTSIGRKLEPATTHLFIFYSQNGQTQHCILSKQAEDVGSVKIVPQAPNLLLLVLKTGNPLVPGAPKIHAEVFVAVEPNGTLAMSYTTTNFPSIAIRVIRDSKVTDTDVVNNVACWTEDDVEGIAGWKNVGGGLLTYNNSGALTVQSASGSGTITQSCSRPLGS